MNIIRNAFKTRRDNPLMYRSHGLSHLTDVSQLYIHHKNISYNSNTIIPQAIGEAITFMAEGLNEGFVQIIHDENQVEVHATIPYEWKEAMVIPADLARVKILVLGNELVIYAEDNLKVPLSFTKTNDQAEYLMTFIGLLGLLGKGIIHNFDFKLSLERYMKKWDILDFIMLCENFYQENKQVNLEVKPISRDIFRGNNLREFELEDNPDNIPVKLLHLYERININEGFKALLVGPEYDNKLAVDMLIGELESIAIHNTTVHAAVLNDYERFDKWLNSHSGPIVVINDIQLLDFTGIESLNTILSEKEFVFGCANMNYNMYRKLRDEVLSKFSYVINEPIFNVSEIKCHLPESQYRDRVLKVYNAVTGSMELRKKLILSIGDLKNWIAYSESLGYKGAFNKVILPLAKGDLATEGELINIFNRF